MAITDSHKTCDDLVLGAVAFYDTVGIVSMDDQSLLRDLLEPLCRSVDSAPFPWRSGEFNSPFRYWLTCQCPSADAAHLLDRHFNPRRSRLSRVDCSVDLIARGTGAAWMLAEWLIAHVTIPWSRKHPLHYEDGLRGTTTYLHGPPRWGCVNVAVYDDRPSKLGGQLCAHMDVRMLSARVVRKRGGLRRPADLFGVDVVALLRRLIRFETVDLARIRQRHVRSGTLLRAIYALAEAREHTCSQAVRAYASEVGLRSARVLRPFSPSWLSRLETTVQFVPAPNPVRL
jgi:hypothetical protein